MAKKKLPFYPTVFASETEEEVKHAYAKEYDIPFSTRLKQDLRTPGVLFEFKLDKPMRKGLWLATVIAQGFYYIHKALMGQILATIPKYLVVADKNEAAILKVPEWRDVYSPITFDWRRAPSYPDAKLVDAVAANRPYKDIHVYDLSDPQELDLFSKNLRTILDDQEYPVEKAYVTLDNFESVFEHWKGIIGSDIGQEHLAGYFVNDLQKHTAYDDDRGVLVFPRLDGKEYHVRPKQYKWFWNSYRRPPAPKDMEGIIARTDRLELMGKRRFTGDFFTPIPFANLGLEYIAKALGDDWQDHYYIWDMACGTGNLEYGLSDYSKVFMSTIDASEVSYTANNNLFPGATIFQYDYLNDDVELVMAGANLLNDKAGWKMPRKLREALADQSKKWMVLFNPPYAEVGAGISSGSNKNGVSCTSVKTHMTGVDLGKASNELFVQFMYRIHREFQRGAQLGVYAKLKYINAQAFESFRSQVFQPEYKGGFIFPASAFQGTKGEWPVSFMVWDWSKRIPIEQQKITVDVYSYDKED